MDFRTMMVHLELESDNTGLLEVAGDLAERFQASVIGIAACEPIQVLYDEGYGTGEVMAQDRAYMAKEIAGVETQFREILADRAKSLEWRSAITYLPLADYIAEQGRAADLIITGKDIGAALLDNTRRVNIGSLAMQAGRPILVIPQGISSLPLGHVIVGWNDTRASRRAVVDALPLLKAAAQITVLQVAPKDELASVRANLADVTAWLGRHGVKAEAASASVLGIEADNLAAELVERRCGLFVAGAYGHSRLTEWVFGGVTRSILLEPDFCTLLSH